MLVGVGTCLTVGQCKAAVAAGAQFVVSPVLDEAVVKEAKRLKTPMVPGCSTPSELNRAHQLGCPIQKLFPEPAGAQNYVTSALGALPFLSVFPTHCDEENAPNYLSAGCKVIGMGNTYLAPEEDIKRSRWAAITDRAITLRRAIEKWQEERKKVDQKGGKNAGKTGNREKKVAKSGAKCGVVEAKAVEAKPSRSEAAEAKATGDKAKKVQVMEAKAATEGKGTKADAAAVKATEGKAKKAEAKAAIEGEAKKVEATESKGQKAELAERKATEGKVKKAEAVNGKRRKPNAEEENKTDSKTEAADGKATPTEKKAKTAEAAVGKAVDGKATKAKTKKEEMAEGNAKKDEAAEGLLKKNEVIVKVTDGTVTVKVTDGTAPKKDKEKTTDAKPKRKSNKDEAGVCVETIAPKRSAKELAKEEKDMETPTSKPKSKSKKDEAVEAEEVIAPKTSAKEVAKEERARAREALAEITTRRNKKKEISDAKKQEPEDRLERALQVHSARHSPSAYEVRGRQWRP